MLSSQVYGLSEITTTIKVKVSHTPQVSDFVPVDGVIVTEGDTLSITVDATDKNSDETLLYRYYIDLVAKTDWIADSTFNYTLTADDIGLNKVHAEVTDGTFTVPAPSEPIEIYVFRSSPDLPE